MVWELWEILTDRSILIAPSEDGPSCAGGVFLMPLEPQAAFVHIQILTSFFLCEVAFLEK